ncbi:MAG TPA: hypothetical protein VN699_17240 [Pirellulales bacterium]|nr:hypothetical protein [Pirellulales bacterium]
MNCLKPVLAEDGQTWGEKLGKLVEYLEHHAGLFRLENSPRPK